jgi:hypothetical protein
MHSAEFRVELAMEREAAWQRLRDLSLAGHYVPGLTSVELTTATREGVGASRRVQQGRFITLDETVVDWREGEGFSLRLHRGERGPLPPMTEAWFDYGLEQRGSQLYLHNTLRYRVGLGVLGELLDRWFLRDTVARSVRDTTVSQKLFYETGEKVTPEMLAEALAALPRDD